MQIPMRHPRYSHSSDLAGAGVGHGVGLSYYLKSGFNAISLLSLIEEMRRFRELDRDGKEWEGEG